MQSFKYKFSDITLKYGLHLGMHVHVNVALRPTSSSSLSPPPSPSLLQTSDIEAWESWKNFENESLHASSGRDLALDTQEKSLSEFVLFSRTPTATL